MPAVRLCVVDGLFYPAEPAALRAQIARCFAAVDSSDDAALPPSKLLITPHAGYEYCGVVAASAYARLTGNALSSAGRRSCHRATHPEPRRRPRAV